MEKIKFQYISCYCLSASYADRAIVDMSFQYISCYCLSIADWIFLVIFHYFNTSHVTVYRKKGKWKGSSFKKFQYISCYCLS